MTARAATAAAFLLAAVAWAGAGCGYSTGSLMPAGVRSVAVEIAGNETFYRQDELAFTRRLISELTRRAHVQVRSRREADAILTSRILSLPRTTLVTDPQNLILNEGMNGEIEVELSERSTGRIIDRFRLRRRSEAVTARGDTIDTERAKLMDELAEDAAIELQKRSYLVARGMLAEGASAGARAPRAADADPLESDAAESKP